MTADRRVSLAREWRPVVGYEGLYEVSDDGQVMSLPRTVMRAGSARMNAYEIHYPGRMLTAVLTSSGYPAVGLSRNGNRRTWTVHELVAAAFLGPRPDDCEIRHLDGDQTNSRVPNLAYGTKSDNRHDAVRHGTHNPHRGDDASHAKLSSSLVLAIRERYSAGGITQAEIAAELGVHRVTVGAAIRGKTWGHVL